MNIDDIHRVLIVGAGTMGQKIALQCAVHGYETTVYDVSAATLESAAAKIRVYAAELVSRKRLSAEESTASLARLSFTTSAEDAARADLLNESVPEDPDLKAKVFARFNALCPPHTIFTTNTSTLRPSVFAAATGRPAQFAALHFYGVWDQNLADVMPHSGTSAETLRLVEAFARRIGQIPLVFRKETPEYIGNAILGAIFTTALNLVFRDDVASIEDVDRSVMLVLGMPVGPFGWLDNVGLDTVWHIAENKARSTGDPQARAAADRLKREYVEKGWLGVKSGKGFYTYPDPAYARSGFLTGEQ